MRLTTVRDDGHSSPTLASELIDLIAKWRDYAFWCKEGAAMDSLDCAAEIMKIIERYPNHVTTTASSSDGEVR